MTPRTPFARTHGRTIVKLLIQSLFVGILLYWMEISPGDIYGWVAEALSSIWNWFSSSGLEYLLLGATIVVPLYLFGRLKDKLGNRD